MADKRKASVDFLEFLASIRHPATGGVLVPFLAQRLGWSDADLLSRWRVRRQVTLTEFIEEILSVLDGIQDQTLDLDRTILTFQSCPLSRFGGRTADQAVSAGEGRRLVQALKSGQVSFH